MLQFLKRSVGVVKKTAIILSVYAIVIALFVSFLNKDKASFKTNNIIELQRKEIYKNINDTELAKTERGRFSIAIYRKMTCGMVGEACTDNPADGDKNYHGSFFGKLNGILISPFTNPPASGVYWAKNTLESSGFVPKTYAAEGIGFAGIKPLMNLWKVFRDISYMILVLVLIAIGFMIMFRMKLNPQTVISVENSLPKIVVSMILITFSFAIAGFMIDMMYVLMAIGISILSNNNAFYDAGQFQNKYMSSGMGVIFDSFFPKGGLLSGGIPVIGGIGFLTYMGDAFFGLLGPTLTILIRTVSGILGYVWLGPRYLSWALGWLPELIHNIGLQAATFGIEIGGLAAAPADAVIKSAASILGMLIGFLLLPQVILGLLIFFTIIMNWFRIFFMLFRAYLQILLMIIFAPIFMLIDAVPGQNAFSGWFKGLLGELLTFPITVILMMTGYVIVNTMVQPGFSLWEPPLLGGTALSAQAYAVLVGMGLMFMIPDLVKFAKDKLGVKPLPISIGLGTFMAGGQAALGGGLGLVGQYSSIAMAFPGLKTAIASKAGFLQKALGVDNNQLEAWKNPSKAQESPKR